MTSGSQLAESWDADVPETGLEVVNSTPFVRQREGVSPGTEAVRVS